MINTMSKEQFHAIYQILDRDDAQDLIDALVVISGVSSDEAAIHYTKLIAAVTSIRFEEKNKTHDKNVEKGNYTPSVSIPAAKTLFPNGRPEENASSSMRKLYLDVADYLRKNSDKIWDILSVEDRLWVIEMIENAK